MSRHDSGAGAIAILLEALDRAYQRPSWHGPNLRGALRGVTATAAAWRPGKSRKCVAEQALHAAYWKYVVRRRLRGDRRGSFPLEGSNWFPITEPLTEATWKSHLKLLDAEHLLLREAVAALSPETLDAPAPGGKGAVTLLALVLGASAHDVYHAGQIQMLKRLQEGDD